MSSRRGGTHAHVRSQAAAREYRSRLQRPCDICRTQKHFCAIPSPGEPCVSCASRKQSCTFDLPPTRRRRSHQTVHSHGSSSVPTTENFTVNVRASPALQPSRVTQDDNDTRDGQGEILPSHMQCSPQNSHLIPESPAAMRDLSEPALGYLSSFNLAPDARLVGGSIANNDVSVSCHTSATQVESLDSERDTDGESHFVGPTVFLALTLDTDGISPPVGSSESWYPSMIPGPSGTGKIKYRQVSLHQSNPAYFVRYPSLQYGPALVGGRLILENVWQLCASADNDFFLKSIHTFRAVTLPALPLVDYTQVALACWTPSDLSSELYNLIAGVIAHTISYIPLLRPLHKQVWSQILIGLEDEFRRPKLRTLQLALLILSSRPGENVGQGDIGLSRAVGVAHVLGLHIDPTNWSIPEWEKSLRIRLFWILLIHDKHRALLFGRPPLLHRDNYNVRLPTMGDFGGIFPDSLLDRMKWSENERLSLESWIGMCRLTTIMDQLSSDCFSARTMNSNVLNSSRDRKAAIAKVKSDLEIAHAEMRLELRWNPRSDILSNPPTGVRSMQLSYLGVLLIAHRLEVGEMGSNCALPEFSGFFSSAMETCSSLIDIVVRLDFSERSMFWMPYSSHHMSNVGSLLLLLAIRARHFDATMSDRAMHLVKTLCTALASFCQQIDGWDLAETALRRLAHPSLTASLHLPSAQEIYRTIANLLGLQIPVFENTDSIESILNSLGMDFDPISFWYDAPLAEPAPVSSYATAPGNSPHAVVHGSTSPIAVLQTAR